MGAEPEDRPAVAAFDEITQIASLMRSIIARNLPVGLIYPHFEVLNLLARRGDGVSPGQIARSLQTTKSSLTNTLQRLSARDLVRVEDCSADGRKKRIWLTAEGRKAYGQCMAGIRPKMGSLSEAFTPREFQDSLPFLRALRGWLAETP
jgi:DNA-binding MarR family transcriptional regulator